MRLIFILFVVVVIWALILLGGYLKAHRSDNSTSVLDGAFEQAGIETGGTPIESAKRLKAFTENRYKSLENLEKEVLGD